MKEEFKIPDLAKLGKWFSVARMGRYASAPDPAALYVWDVRLQKAFLEDISHVEVLLRNFISERLAADWIRANSRVESVRRLRPPSFVMTATAPPAVPCEKQYNVFRCTPKKEPS